VPPGDYPLYIQDISIYWLLTGTINQRTLALGDGMIAINDVDKPSDDVVFYSKRYGPDEFKALLKEFQVKNSPLVFRLSEPIPS
jgi:hypothetical protein